MNRRNFMKSLALTVVSAQLVYPKLLFAADSADLATALQLQLSGPGRVGFYIDYSELNGPGTHTFYVCRTHGTQGTISVNYSTGGDAHSNTNGTLTWADGEADIKFFTVNVDSKSAGEHRIWALLGSPTGGAVLHSGSLYTRAYGVIEDATVASDNDAVFYDSAAASGGNGTQSSPYNNIYTAIAGLGSRRYLYGRGVTVPNTTNTTGAGGTARAPCIFMPPTRTGEDDRLYIRNWPGSSWEIDGQSSSSGAAGFYTNSGNSFITFRGIDFKNLDGTPTGTINGHAIMFFYGDSRGINIELCSADNINGTANNGAYQLWGVDGSKVWRSTSNNIQKQGDNANGNTGGVYTYNGSNISVQRCEFSNSGNGVFHKRYAAGTVSTSVRFCIFENTIHEAIHYSTSGSGDPSHEYTIVQNNIIKSSLMGIDHNSGYNNSLHGIKHAWSNNIFDTVGWGLVAPIHFNEAFGAQIYNNIFVNCRRMWNETNNSSGIKTPGVEFANYNLDHGTTWYQKYGHSGNPYTGAELISATGHGGNDTTTDPLFSGDEYRLTQGSPAAAGGVNGATQGVYLVGIEQIGVGEVGAVVESPYSKPQPPSSITIKRV